MNSDASTIRASNPNKRKGIIMAKAHAQAQTEEAVIAGRFEVMLAGEPRTIQEKPLAENMQFRRAVGNLLGELFDPLTPFLMDFFTKRAQEEKTAKAQRGKKRNPLVKRKEKSGEDEPVEELLRKALRELAPVLMGEGADELILALWLYAPELEEFKDDSTFEEQVTAGLEVLGVAFPLVLSLAKGMMSLINRM